ncbi:MAG TPA: hypothetical protein HPP56_02460 [Nitrospirae bacterium]|nr:hypothetical protein [Nitrospirota bacterium]
MQCLLLKFLKISFIRCRIKIFNQPFLLDFVKFSVLSLILCFVKMVKLTYIIYYTLS